MQKRKSAILVTVSTSLRCKLRVLVWAKVAEVRGCKAKGNNVERRKLLTSSATEYSLTDGGTFEYDRPPVVST